jgi:hypothetical protein
VGLNTARASPHRFECCPLCSRAIGRSEHAHVQVERRTSCDGNGAERTQTTANRRKWSGLESRLDKPKSSPTIADSCAHNKTVRRGSTSELHSSSARTASPRFMRVPGAIPSSFERGSTFGFAKRSSPQARRPAATRGLQRVRPVRELIRGARDVRSAWCATVPSRAGRGPTR